MLDEVCPLSSEGDLLQLTVVRAEIYGAVALKSIETEVREETPLVFLVSVRSCPSS